MCLTMLDNKLEPCKEGYQVKYVEDGYYIPPDSKRRYVALFRYHPPVGIGETIEAEGKRIATEGRNESYITGFHVFHNLKDARFLAGVGDGRIVVKVRVSGKTTTGYQWTHTGYQWTHARWSIAPVTVCEKITPLEEVE